MPDDSRNYAPQITNALTVANTLPYGVIPLSEHKHKSGPCILSIKRTAGAGTPSFTIIEAADGANLRALQNHINSDAITINYDQAIQLPFAPKSIGVFSGTGGTWTCEVRLHF